MVPRRRLELLHLAATASKTVMSTIPSPGLVSRTYNLPSCTPLECRPAIAETRSRGYGSDVSSVSQTRISAHLPFHHLGTSTIPSPGSITNMVLEMGLEPTRPRGIRIWNVRVYHSTTRAECIDISLTDLRIIEKRQENASKNRLTRCVISYSLWYVGASEIRGTVIHPRT